MIVKGTGYQTTAVSLKDRIELGFVFKSDVVNTGMYAVISYTNHNGKECEITVEGTKFTNYKNGWRVAVDNLTLADGNQLITCTIYDAMGNEVATAKDNVSSYLRRVLDATTASAELKALATATLKLTASAYAFFH